VQRAHCTAFTDNKIAFDYEIKAVLQYPSQSCSKGGRTRSRAFSVGEGWVALSMHPEEYPPRKDYE